MSTRGVIAVPHGDGWHGCYTGSDSYPTWSGPRWWKIFHEQCLGDRDCFEQDIILAHPGGWRSPDDTCYCHDPADPRTEATELFTDADGEYEALFLEWIYVFGRRVLTIFCSVRAEGMHRCERADDGYWWMSPNYRWALVTQIPLAGEEPDWAVIEAMGDALREQAEAEQEAKTPVQGLQQGWRRQETPQANPTASKQCTSL